MRPFVSLSLFAALLMPLASTVHAQAVAVHVPGDYPTIQAALNAAPTIIYVAQGTYPETLDVQRSVSLLPDPPADPRDDTPFPHVAGMNIRHLGVYSPTVLVRGFRFTGIVTQTNNMTHPGVTTIEACRLDKGFWTLGSQSVDESIKIRSCVITGDVYIYAYFNEFTGNMLWKGKADIHSNGGNGATVRDNLVIGPSSAGLITTSMDSPGIMSGNLVSGVGTAYSLANGTAVDNTAQDCVTAFTGINSPGLTRTFQTNRVLRCATGFELLPLAGANHVIGNDLDSVTYVGIHAGTHNDTDVEDNSVSVTGSHGIWLEGYGTVTGNRVLYAGGDGIRSSQRVEWNVVGRSHGNGITAPEARHNTAFSNDGTGLSLSSATADTISNNISYGNLGYGLRWTGTGHVLLRCNDWFGNIAGATQGVSVGLTDLAVNPEFCNQPKNNVYLGSGSPLLSAPHCGLIGALGMGCLGVTDAPETGAVPMRFSVRPNPAGSIVEMQWARGNDPTVVEVFDLSGALRFRADVPAGVSTLRWSGEGSDRRPLPRGMYFVRRTSGEQHEQTRIVLRR